MRATLAVANWCGTPGSEKVREEVRKGQSMPFKGIPSLPPFAWAVPPSPARDKHACFFAFADSPLDSVDTVAIGSKSDQFYCAFLRTIV